MSYAESVNDNLDESPLENIDAEQMALGCLLLNNDAFYRVDGILSAGDFSEALHSRIYEAIAHKVSQGEVANAITLAPIFHGDPAMRDVGGTAYLARLSASATPPGIVHDYANLIRGLSTRRRLIETAKKMIEAAESPVLDQSPDSLVSGAQSDLDDLLGKEARKEAIALSVALDDACAGVEAAYTNQGAPVGISTGIRALDHHIGGLEDSNLIIVAGRPGMGKTALATCIAGNMSREGKRGLFFSLEMSGRELAQRMLSGYSGITVQDMKRGNINDASYRRIKETSDRLAPMPLRIDPTGALTIQSLAARARRQKRLHGLDYIVVDYIQLMAGSGNKNNNRTNDVTEITTGLKALAKDLDVPIVALSQLSRAVEMRADKRPMLSDLRESGSIEQDADLVLFVYRDHEYLKKMTQPKGSDDLMEFNRAMESSEGKAEVIVAKFRSGPTGTVFLAFEDSTTTFRDREAHH